METAHWIALGVAAITGGLARDILGAIRNLLRPRSGERRTELERAWHQADREARRRRIVEEYASPPNPPTHRSPMRR